MRYLLALVFALSSTAFAQKAPYEPTSGQEGKDVVWIPTPQVVVDRMLVGSSRVDLQACKLEYSIVSPK